MLFDRVASGCAGAAVCRARGLFPLLVAAAVLSCGGGGGGDGDESWLYPLTVATDVIVRDVDGDGRNDVLTLEQRSPSASQKEGRLLVYRQTAAGAFAAPDVYVVGTYPWRLVAADLDGDGADDLLVTDVEELNALVLRQARDNRGHFGAASLLADGFKAYDAAVADLDGDGAVDVALADARAGESRVVLLLQDGSRPGEFEPAISLAMPGRTAHVAAGDLNGDGRADLVASVQTGGTGVQPPEILLAYLPQTPEGELGAPVVLGSHVGLNVARLAVADHDGDGADDLHAYLTPFSSDYSATLTVVRQALPPGSFLAAANTRLDGVRGLDDAVFADFDRDGRPDAAVAGFFPVGSPSTVEARVNLFTRAGGGLYAPTISHDVPVAVSRIAAGDLDGDGAVDLVAFAGEDGCQVMRQLPGAPGSFAAPRPLR